MKTMTEQKIHLIHKLDDGIKPGATFEEVREWNASPIGLINALREADSYSKAAVTRWGGIGAGEIHLMFGEHRITSDDANDTMEDLSDHPADRRPSKTERAAAYLATVSKAQ